MSRKDEINIEADRMYNNAMSTTGEVVWGVCGFKEGARWADANPSDETICKVLNLWAEYNRSLEEFPEHSEEPGTTASEACYKFIRENWNNIKV